MFTEDGRRNGWCITYNGLEDVIYYGWYIDDVKTGNYWNINVSDWTIVSERTGWYE